MIVRIGVVQSVKEIEVDLGSSLSNAEAVDDDGFGLSRPWWKR